MVSTVAVQAKLAHAIAAAQAVAHTRQAAHAAIIIFFNST
jgi:hypothetical protein